MNVFMISAITPGEDPLGLRELSEPKPEPDRLEKDWAVVSAVLEKRHSRRRYARLGAFAAAASVVLVIALLALPRPDVGPAPPLETTTAETAAPAGATPVQGSESTPADMPTTDELMAMSQDMEQQLRFMRAQVGAMPSSTLVYQVELQDLIGQVDDALSLSPGSRELWGQRLGLQLDLMKLYRNELRRDYLRLASL